MKIFLILSTLLVSSIALAHNHEETKKKVGHGKEHEHVEKPAMDHEHEDAHHEKHDHKAHHPDHVDSVDVKKSKKK